MVSFVASFRSSGRVTGPMSPVSIRARSRVTSPLLVRRAASLSIASMRGLASTATATSGRSSDRVSDRSVRGWRLAPNPSMPRSRTLVAISCRPYRSSSASATKAFPVRWRSPK